MQNLQSALRAAQHDLAAQARADVAQAADEVLATHTRWAHWLDVPAFLRVDGRVEAALAAEHTQARDAHDRAQLRLDQITNRPALWMPVELQWVPHSELPPHDCDEMPHLGAHVAIAAMAIAEG